MIVSDGDHRGDFPNVDGDEGDGNDSVNNYIGIVRIAGVSSFGSVSCCHSGAAIF